MIKIILRIMFLVFCAMGHDSIIDETCRMNKDNRHEVCIKSGILESVVDTAPLRIEEFLFPWNLVINESFSSIAENAFERISPDITSLTLSPGGELIKVTPNSFKGLSKIKTLIIPAKIEPVDKELFRELTSLDTVSVRFDGFRFSLGDLLLPLQSRQKSLKQFKFDDCNLQGLWYQHFKGESITYLSLQSNNLIRLKSATFKSLNELKILSLAQNNITNIEHDNFEGLPNLRKLDLSGNRISTLNSKTFVNLNRLGIDLRLEKNNLSYVAIGTFEGSKIDRLDLSHNNLTIIETGTFNGITNLQMLDLSDNQIGTIGNSAFSSMRIEELILARNKLTFMEIQLGTFDGLNVERLDISQNIITAITKDIFNKVDNLYRLYLYDNQIERIENSAFSGLTLGELVLAHNALKNIQAGAFTGLKVIHLDLSENLIGNISPDAFKGAQIGTLYLPETVPIYNLRKFLNSTVISYHSNEYLRKRKMKYR